jgi:PIN domain nuclease of toxin-antitoxin system
VRLLLDTCVFLWLATEPSRLSQTATNTLDDEQNELFLSDVSIWEITLKHKAGKLALPDAPRRWVPDELQFHGIQSVPILSEAMFVAGELPGDHRDPFDRLIAAHVQLGGFQLVSPDDAFKTLGIDLLW